MSGESSVTRTPCFPLLRRIALLTILLLSVCCVVDDAAAEDSAAAMAEGSENGAGVPNAVAPEGPLTFNDCLRLALRQSPFLVSSALEIKVRRLDVWDSRADLLPDLYVNSSIRLNNPDDRDSEAFSYDISFGSYDPIRAYFSIGSKQLMTDYVILEHLRVIDELFYNIGIVYIALHHLGRLEAVQQDALDWARQNKAFATKRYNEGWGTALEVLIADRTVTEAEQKLEKFDADRRLVLEQLKGILGLMPEQALAVDVDDIRQQVLAGFSYRDATIELAAANSLSLKKKQIEVELQEDSLVMAYSEYMPKYSFGINREYNTVEDEDVYLASIGLVVPIWDWGERYRGVIREKRKITQARSELRVATLNLRRTIMETKARCKELDNAIKLFTASAEVEELNRKQAEIQYKSGSISYDAFVQRMKQSLDTRSTLLAQEFEYDKAVFNLRQLSGLLYSAYVDAASFTR